MEFGGFEIKTEVEAIKFMKKLTTMMKDLLNESITAKNVMEFIGICSCLKEVNNYESKEIEHYKLILLELIDAFQCKIEGGTQNGKLI